MELLRAPLLVALALLAPACRGPAPPPRSTGAPPPRAPRLAVDAGHANYHTADDRYRPFAELLRAAGFEVVSRTGPLDAPGTLDDLDVLVIANATGPTPTDPALTAAEAAAVARWIDDGGSLWLIADHFPFGGAVAPLAAALEVEMSNGMVGDEERRWPGADDAGNIVYRAGAELADHPITRGRTADEVVTTVVTFVGQSLRGPAESVALLRLSASAREMLPPDRRVESAAGRAQGLVFERGRGRVYVAGEAAMFTEQEKADGTPMGMNAPGNDDRQYTINVARWLAREL